MSDRAKKVSELTEVTSITASDSLMYVVVNANTAPASRKIKVSNLPPGPQGVQGTTGAQGSIGPQGIQGTSGITQDLSGYVKLSSNTDQIIISDNSKTQLIAINGVVGPEISFSNATSFANINDTGIINHSVYLNGNGFGIDLDYNDALSGYKSFWFGVDGAFYYPDGTAQNTAWTGSLSGITETYLKQKFAYESGLDVTMTDVLDCTQGTTKFYVEPYNIFALEIQNANLNPGECLTVKVVIKQQAQASQTGQAFIPQNLYIFDGVNPSVLLDVKWVGGSLPTPSLGKIDVIEYTIFNNSGTYTALGERKVHG